MRSAMYFTNGDWRQWEANDCNDVDSVHNDHQRHLPYILYFPETEKKKMYAWAKYQQGDGMIQEDIDQLDVEVRQFHTINMVDDEWVM